MKAIGYSAAGPADTLDLIEIDRPAVGPRDLLVAVKGLSVNPVDVKLRAAPNPGAGRAFWALMRQVPWPRWALP
ncbi:hypothetical protein [Sulfitobacter pontiacus]|uniref:hypothetical protein n=1 Tax=Sulfitobacter pontiacus TaxID=60137 RepID=UPI0030ED1BA2